MTARFPDLLPLPLVEEYSITPNEAIIRTQMESGTARQRRRLMPYQVKLLLSGL
ncbi:MAG: hypothetical protein IKY58_03450 [Paludibacteraceae bacterium]|nr:hypothetical protein [Paludibacteraceae bacterium]